MVSQMNRLGQGLETDAVFDQAGDSAVREIAPRATTSESYSSVLRSPAIVSTETERDSVSTAIALPKQQVRVRAHQPHRDDRMAWLHRTRRGLRQQRRVEHVVARVDQRHVDLLMALTQVASDVAAGETGPENDDPMAIGHTCEHTDRRRRSTVGVCNLPPWPIHAPSPRHCTTGPSRSPSPWPAPLQPWRLIVIFTELVDWVGDFWSQVIYFVAIFGGVLLAAQRSRASDSKEPSRLSRGAPAITPAGLPGPFVMTQAPGRPGLDHGDRRQS